MKNWGVASGFYIRQLTGSTVAIRSPAPSPAPVIQLLAIIQVFMSVGLGGEIFIGVTSENSGGTLVFG